MRVPNGRPASRRPLVCGRRRGKSSPLVRPSVGRASIVSRGDGRGRIQEGREGGRDNLLRNYARASPTPDGVRRVVAIAGGGGGGRVSPFLVAIHGPELQGCVGFLKYGMNLGIGGQN